MGRNEIRLRRNRMSAGNIARHRNYGELLNRLDREQKWKRMFRLFIYFLAAAFLIIILVIVLQWEQRQQQKKQANTTHVFAPSPS